MSNKIPLEKNVWFGKHYHEHLVETAVSKHYIYYQPNAIHTYYTKHVMLMIYKPTM